MSKKVSKAEDLKEKLRSGEFTPKKGKGNTSCKRIRRTGLLKVEGLCYHGLGGIFHTLAASYAGKAIKMEVLNPPESSFEGTSHDVDNNGPILRLNWGKLSFLFAADIREEAEFELIGQRANLRSTVLKVAHHGSYCLVLPTETYRVRACPSHNGPNYVSEYYDDTHIYDEATPISVTVPNDTPNIDFTLEIGGIVSGHVYQQDGVTPIPNVNVSADDYDTGEWMEGTSTEQDGSCSLVLPTGAYRIRACPSCSGRGYFDEWYDNTRYSEQATAVSVTSPDDTPNINFSPEASIPAG